MRVKNPTKLLAATISTVALTTGALLGAMLGVLVHVPDQNATASEASPSTTVTAFEVNDSGQTLGEFGVGLTKDPSATPDLILAVASNGTEGYVVYVDVFGAPTHALDQAVATGGKPRPAYTVPVYAKDGKTVIGEYLANSGH